MNKLSPTQNTPALQATYLINNRDVNPPRPHILRIDGKGMINDVICEKKKKKNTKKDVVGIVTFDLIGLLPTNHIIAYITMACWSL